MNMNRKKIELVLAKKHDAFVKTITDDKVRELVNNNSIITGGAIVSLFQGERVNDFDYYFTDLETTLAVAKYYVADFVKRNPKKMVPTITVTDGRIAIKIQSAGVVSESKPKDKYEYFESRPQAEAGEYLDEVTSVLEKSPLKMVEEADEINTKELERLDGQKDPYRPIFMSSNAITLANDVQLIMRFYGEPETIHENYDFLHCTNYWLSSDRKVHVNQDALECILTKELKYSGSKYPLCSIIRTRKFINRGWFINAGQYLKMCYQLSRLDLDDIEVLQEQLTGVDSAYFAEVIEGIKQEQKKNSEWKLESTYLATLVDKIF